MKAQQQSPKGHRSLFILSVYTAKRSANYQTNSRIARTRRRKREQPVLQMGRSFRLSCPYDCWKLNLENWEKVTCL